VQAERNGAVQESGDLNGNLESIHDFLGCQVASGVLAKQVCNLMCQMNSFSFPGVLNFPRCKHKPPSKRAIRDRISRWSGVVVAMGRELVSKDLLRGMFNEDRYCERMLEGEFQARIVAQNRKRRGDSRVRNTLSQTVEYWDKFGNLIARVHQYRKRDGSLGGSGRPDPKMQLHEGVLYALDMREQWDAPTW
jgi:hypothetical protein